MYEDTVQKIQSKFDATRQRIEAKFELVIKTIDSFMAMVIAVIVGTASVVTAVVKKSAVVLVYLLLVVFIFVPLVFSLALGLCLGGFWGVALTLLSVGLTLTAVVVVWVALASKSESGATVSKANAWRQPVFSVGLAMNLVVIILYIIHFQTTTYGENFLVAWVHQIYDSVISAIRHI